MEEYGQPMHAFDYDTIAGHKIVVKRAEDGASFTTLDGIERKLDSDVVMICDAEKPVAIGGIMGGENSMITEDATTVLFEAACFNGTNIRLSSKRIGLTTDASQKFDKGLDPNTTMEAINRACALMEEFGAGEAVGGFVDSYAEPRKPVEIDFEPDKINALLGTSFSPEEMIGYFEAVDLSYDKETNKITVPTWRQDVLRTCDLAEEVARFYGYDKIPSTLPAGEATAGKLQFDMRVLSELRNAAEGCGFMQGYCYSFESPKVFDKLLFAADAPERNAIRIANPLGEDFSVMRTTSLNGILSSLGTNYSHRNKAVRLYEAGNVYLAKALPLTELPDERMRFTLGMYGCGGFFEMKGIVEHLLKAVGMDEAPEYVREGASPALHPGRRAAVIYKGKTVGEIGELHPTCAKNYGIGEQTVIAVIDVPSILEFATFDRKYVGIAKFPAVTRDISFVLPASVTAGEIEKVLRQRGGSVLESLELFDVYEGSHIADGFKSMAYSLTFRHKEKTMEEAEINSVMKKILNGLSGLGAELRK